ncbi:MAG TPA: DUF5985 family protein [Polyangiaceae bacterium]|nr:DUF5985 family protein [Polyangiaceae bacterium]
MSDFLHGAITLASLAIALFFLRYWRSTHDRLFAMFSAAFALLAIHWLVSSAWPHMTMQAHALRFFAFVLIALAVLDKNRGQTRSS